VTTTPARPRALERLRAPAAAPGPVRPWRLLVLACLALAILAAALFFPSRRALARQAVLA
jgi:hypothetical protein